MSGFKIGDLVKVTPSFIRGNRLTLPENLVYKVIWKGTFLDSWMYDLISLEKDRSGNSIPLTLKEEHIIGMEKNPDMENWV